MLEVCVVDSNKNEHDFAKMLPWASPRLRHDEQCKQDHGQLGNK